MAELADALDLGSSVLDVQVQLLLPAPNIPQKSLIYKDFGGLFILSNPRCPLSVHYFTLKQKTGAILSDSPGTSLTQYIRGLRLPSLFTQTWILS